MAGWPAKRKAEWRPAGRAGANKLPPISLARRTFAGATLPASLTWRANTFGGPILTWRREQRKREREARAHYAARPG